MGHLLPMNDTNALFGGLNLVIALIAGGLCFPLARGKIGPNRWYGFRFGQWTDSPERWYRINRAGGQGMLRWSALLAVSGILALVYATLSPGSSLLCGCLPWLPLILFIPAFQAGLLAFALKRDMALN